MKTKILLISKNSFLTGMGRVLDIGSIRNKRVHQLFQNGEAVDKEAILSDWTVTGDDMRSAYGKIKKEVGY